MCNHYRARNLQGMLTYSREWADETEGDCEAVEDAWPKRAMPLVYSRDGKRVLTSMRWGVWPWFEAKPRLVTNARDDKLVNGRLWPQSARHRRCLVPADGFYQPTGPDGAKWEVLFRFADDRPFFFAGLWARDPTGGDRGFTLVTGQPNELVAAIPHDRMPVILGREAAAAWLGDQPLPESQLLGLCAPYPADEMVREDMPRPERPSKPRRVEPPATTRPIQPELFDSLDGSPAPPANETSH